GSYFGRVGAAGSRGRRWCWVRRDAGAWRGRWVRRRCCAERARRRGARWGRLLQLAPIQLQRPPQLRVQRQHLLPVRLTLGTGLEVSLQLRGGVLRVTTNQQACFLVGHGAPPGGDAGIPNISRNLLRARKRRVSTAGTVSPSSWAISPVVKP